MTFLTIPEAAQKIKKSRTMIDQWINDKVDPLPCIPIQKRGTLIVEEELDAYIIKRFHKVGNKKIERLVEY